MKKLLVVFLMMIMIPAFALAGESVLLVELPQDAQMIEDVHFEDGDFIQTYQFSNGAQVQLLRYTSYEVQLADLAASEWVGMTDVYSLNLDQVGGCLAESMRFVWAENGNAAYDVTLIAVKAQEAVLVMEAVFPAALGEASIDASLDAMIASLDVLRVGEEIENAEVG